MNIAAIRIEDFDYYNSQETSGDSESAKNVEMAKRNALEQYTSSFTTKDRHDLLMENILSMDIDILMPNWDGYGAKAIEPEVIENALKFLFRLKENLPLPEFTPEPDGEMALEWYGPEKSVFSISFGKSKIVNYSGVFSNKTKVYGQDECDVEFFEKFIKRI